MFTSKNDQSLSSNILRCALILYTINLSACGGDDTPDNLSVDAGTDTCQADCDLASSDSDAPVNVEPSWQEVFSDLDGALLSIWGTGPDNVWTTGSDPGDGLGPYVLHYDGQGDNKSPSHSLSPHKVKFGPRL